MHSCEFEWPSPLLNFLDHIQFPHCCGLFRTFPPLLQTHSLQSLLWDVCNQLQSFDIQSCCMMSIYHIRKYNQLTRNIKTVERADRAPSESISWDWTHVFSIDNMTTVI